MGLWYYKRGQFIKAESYFRQAIQTLTQRNPNPYDGEAYYNLGLCLKMQSRYGEAYDAFFKATWNAAWQDASFLELARIDTRKGDYTHALERIDRSLVRNWHGHAARHLKVALLRKLSRTTQARQLIDDTLTLDPFNMGCLYERYLIEPSAENLQAYTSLMRGHVHNYIEYALDYAQAGLFDESSAVLNQYVQSDLPAYPIVCYFLALFAYQEKRRMKWHCGCKKPR
ncbi:tetratricopeptide repeat protein [Spirosoma sp. KNUC1025]|nr:tetratricopeptide repeat protein [Spirosoma sp. KNUC1025]